MVAKSFGRALALLLLSPPAAFALGLGDIHLQSSLNAPLNAEVDLVGATPEDLVSLHAAIANHDTFTRYGLDWPAYLGGVSMRPEKTPDGRDVIRISSREAITEPFITFLIDVTWARGQLTREYTVLLDPPIYTPGQNAANQAPLAAPAVGTGTREGAISRAPAASSTSAAAPAESAPASQGAPTHSRAPAGASTQAGTSRVVNRGDTLSQIAGSISSAGGASTRSWMLAIYQANPSAFEGNMNLLHAGAVLRIPDASTAQTVSPTDALKEIRRQYAAWRNQPAAPAAPAAAASESGHLHLVTPSEPTKQPSSQAATEPSTTGAASGGNAALEARMHELEAQLQESRRLLEARNADLAKLQAQLGANAGAASATAAAPGAAATPPSAPPAAATPPPSTAAPAPEATENAPSAATAPPAAHPRKPAVAHAAPPSPPSESFVSSLMRYWWIAALLVVAILARIGVSAWRSRQESNFDDSLGRLASAGADAAVNRDSLGDTAKLRAVRDPTIVVEEGGAHERPRPQPALAPPPSAAARPAAAPADTLSHEAAINLDQGDPLAEADFHMAYGLYDQAADLVRIAIARDPERRELKLKLLEVFFVWGNKEQFLQAAHELAETRDQAAPGEWEKIVIMGKQLAADDPLFSGGAQVSGAAAGGVDLDLEGGESRIDFDLLGEPVPEDAAQGLDLDIGSAIGDQPDAASGSQTTRATDANLALHGLDDSSSATTRQMTAHMDRMAEAVEPTVEQPNLQHDDNPTIRQKVERAIKQGGAGETAELAIDDLGLDLGGLDTVDQPHLSTSSPDAPTLVAGLDDTSRQAMHDELTAQVTAPGNAATGAWRMKPEDMDATLPPVALSEFDDKEPVSTDATSATAHLASLKGGEGLDFDLTDMEGSTAAAANSANDIDLDVGPTTAADTHFTITQKLSSEELALPDLEPATMSEVGTKLDLARAYMDMGDPEGARNILEEVLNEGSVAQKQEAQRLLQSLPG
jgi:pilus assembly protein FimV